LALRVECCGRFIEDNNVGALNEDAQKQGAAFRPRQGLIPWPFFVETFDQVIEAHMARSSAAPSHEPSLCQQKCSSD
jgi:hypothetical protein